MLTSLQKTWGSLTVGQRTALAAVLAVVFGGMLFITQVASRPSYAVLFSNMEPEDAGAVTSKLRELKVDYHISQGGRAIEVPADKVYDLRLTMATEGLPRGGTVGFELFDKTSFTATDFSQHLNYRRALEGELTRTLNRLDGVLESRVHLAMPEKQLFEDKEQPVTASVVLHLRPGYELDDHRVAGIVHLVSSAVEGLKPQNVTIHNAQGELLSGGSGDSPRTENQVQLQEQYERRLETELQHLVERVVGPGRAAIQVSADLNWDQSETTSETYHPSGDKGRNLPTEEQSTRETYGPGSPRPPRGVPGVASNLTVRATALGAESGASGEYMNTHQSTHYAVDKVVERRIVAPGKIKRLSVAVLLDQTITPVQQSALRSVLTAAAGLDVDPPAKGGRGDRIELRPMPFDKSTVVEETKAADKAAKQGFQTELVKNGAAVVVVVLVMIASLLVGRRLLAPPQGGLDTVLGEPLAPHVTTAVPTGGAGIPGRGSGPTTPVSAAERARQVAAQRPDEVARQLQTWMSE